MTLLRLPFFAVICPKVEEVMPADGAPRLGWLRMLYHSARNCSRIRSRMGCHRIITISMPNVSGMRSIGAVRVPVPKLYAAGEVYAVVSNLLSMFCPLVRLPSFERFAKQPYPPDAPGKEHAAPMEIGVPVCAER